MYHVVDVLLIDVWRENALCIKLTRNIIGSITVHIKAKQDGWGKSSAKKFPQKIEICEHIHGSVSGCIYLLQYQLLTAINLPIVLLFSTPKETRLRQTRLFWSLAVNLD